MRVVVVGVGEYVSGLSSNEESDKSRGVVALTLFDLRQRGLVEEIVLCGRDPAKEPLLQKHFQKELSAPYGLNCDFFYHPKTNRNESAWREVLDESPQGSAVIVVTPDNLHFEIAEYALRRSLHVLVAKPLVETLAQHKTLKKLALDNDVDLRGEYHKRYDPMYKDAIIRARSLGRFNHFSSYMSQPKRQLETFRKWAGKAADISSYLNSHHLDLHAQMIGKTYRPERVTAMASSGIGRDLLKREMADTISLSVQWRSHEGSDQGVGLYTASWVAPDSDVHSQQRFFYSAEGGEISVDQAHRGYTLATSETGLRSLNPLFMQYEPIDGSFAGQQGYGYRSVESFLRDAASGRRSDQDFRDLYVTAILEAGRRSLAADSRPVEIFYADEDAFEPSGYADFVPSQTSLRQNSELTS